MIFICKDRKGKGRQNIGFERTCNLILVVLNSVQLLTYKRIIEWGSERIGNKFNRNMPDFDIKISYKGVGLMNDKTFNNDVRMTDEIITNIWK